MHQITRNRLTHAVLCALLTGVAAPVLAATPQITGTAAQWTQADAPQTTDAPSQAEPTQSASAKPAKDADKTAPTTLGAVQVTAQGRKQEVQNVPIAIQVVDAKSIRDHEATDISTMDIFVPGLVVSATQPTQPDFQIRGIGGNGFGIGFGPSVGVYVDGVYTAGSGAALVAFNDVKRVEVLKGPQGTLFGRSAAAGAISVITNEPSDKFEAEAGIRFGNYGERYSTALLNVPAGKDMAFRISVIDNQSNGWLQDAASGRHYGKNDDWGARLSWRWNINDNTDVVVDWMHERLNQAPQAAIGLVPLSNDTNQRAPFPPDPATYLNPLHAPLYNDAMGGIETRRYDSLTMHVNHYWDWGQLTSITNYRHFKTLNREDWDGTNHNATYLDSANIESNSALYQEFRLSGNNSLANWVGGVSWYKENGYQTSQVRLLTNSIDSMLVNLGVPTGTPDGTLYNYFSQVLAAYALPYTLLGDTWSEEIDNHLKSTSTAAYGDVIWHLNDHINLTTGARFTRDQKDFTWYNPPRYAPQLDQTIDALDSAGLLAAFGVDPSVFRQNLVFTEAVGVPVPARYSGTDFSPRVVLDDHFTDHVMGYISAAKGYKAGGFDSVLIGSTVAPETVWNYEAGIKTVFPDQHLLFNASVYHYKYSNLQSLTLNTHTPSGIPEYTADTSDQKANGAEAEVQWQPIDALLLHANVAYIDSVYSHKIADDGADLSGQPTGIPKLSFAVGLQYTWQLSSGRLAFNIDQAYRGKGRCNSDSQLQGSCQVSPNFQVNGSQSRTDMRLGWTSQDGHWSAAVYANNLFNRRYVLGVTNVSATTLGTPFGIISPPRMFGVALQWKY